MPDILYDSRGGVLGLCPTLDGALNRHYYEVKIGSIVLPCVWVFSKYEDGDCPCAVGTQDDGLNFIKKCIEAGLIVSVDSQLHIPILHREHHEFVRITSLQPPLHLEEERRLCLPQLPSDEELPSVKRRRFSSHHR